MPPEGCSPLGRVASTVPKSQKSASTVSHPRSESGRLQNWLTQRRTGVPEQAQLRHTRYKTHTR